MAGFPAASETLAVTLTVPWVSALTWGEVKETDQAPPAAIVPVAVVPPTLTETVRSSAPDEVPEIVSEDSSSALLTKPSVEMGVVIASVGAEAS